MMLPLFVLYILANIYFQLAIKNSMGNQYPCKECWNHTYLDGHIQYYNSFKLMDWYYNPVLWALIMSFAQALSHMFEREYTSCVLLLHDFLAQFPTEHQSVTSLFHSVITR